MASQNAKLRFQKYAVLVLLVIFLLGTILFFIAGVSYYFYGFEGYTEEGAKSTGASLIVCGIPLLLLTLIFILLYWRVLKKEKALEEREENKKLIIGFLKLYRRVSLSTISSHLNIPLPQLVELITELIAEGSLKAHIDRTTGELFIDDALAQARVENIKCPNCGAVVSGIYMLGEAVKCPYCGTVFKVEK